jgi:hypothetical protein
VEGRWNRNGDPVDLMPVRRVAKSSMLGSLAAAFDPYVSDVCFASLSPCWSGLPTGTAALAAQKALSGLFPRS